MNIEEVLKEFSNHVVPTEFSTGETFIVRNSRNELWGLALAMSTYITECMGLLDQKDTIIEQQLEIINVLSGRNSEIKTTLKD